MNWNYKKLLLKTRNDSSLLIRSLLGLFERRKIAYYIFRDTKRPVLSATSERAGLLYEMNLNYLQTLFCD